MQTSVCVSLFLQDWRNENKRSLFAHVSLSLVETSLSSRLLSYFALTAEICGTNIKEFDRHDDMLFPVFLHVIDHSIYNAILIQLSCYTCFSAHAYYHRLAESKTFTKDRLTWANKLLLFSFRQSCKNKDTQTEVCILISLVQN
jgi:hypothetical protein